MLSAISLSKTFVSRRTTVKAVDDFSINGRQGEAICLMGDNGAGKTTIVKMICGLITPDSGKIAIHAKQNRKKPRLGVVLEGARNIYWPFTAWENIDVYCRLRGLNPKSYYPKIDQIIETLSLEKYRNRIAGTLSRGNMQKVAIACALAIDADLLLLDEPTLGLDAMIALQMYSAIKKAKTEGATILITTHDMEFVENIADKLVIIKDGKLAIESTPQKLIEQYGNGDNRLSTAYRHAMYFLNSQTQGQL